ncbi:DHBP synthase RibB-like alpha/beta domain-containing protein [Xylariomycetidae sp. FL0641]|nr:DHBP synthase RibB-like alpha/beta domain-containing protein [Xylariomycetidae sp. FL0641]
MAFNAPLTVLGKNTRVLRVSRDGLGQFREGDGPEKLGIWDVSTEQSSSLTILQEAAEYLKTQDLPVAFPTETVYGLGADATRSAAVKGIYAAKGRPSDNPLITHISDLEMLRNILTPPDQPGQPDQSTNGTHDSIPQIYKPLIERFWPGPLTILLPNPTPSKLAPEVTAGLSSFGVRMPNSPLALSLIKLAGAPLAAPSANASTKPSPTMAEHVLEDMDGRIDIILDGGPCDVGVESTVVDGLCSPPVILRPGGVGIEELRTCPGWEGVEIAYRDQSESGKSTPRAPGMKYKHYSPKAMVALYEAGSPGSEHGVPPQHVDGFLIGLEKTRGETGAIRVGTIRTRNWKPAGGLPCSAFDKETISTDGDDTESQTNLKLDVQVADLLDHEGRTTVGKVMDVSIGKDTRSVAQGLFSALRELDRRGADLIFVEGIRDDEDIGAAVMNRLRKAATHIRP